jgi:glycosyltransferase involved in cell wall biosynthesis
MKIYSYMAAGRAILATQIRSHTQVLDEDTAMLVEPNPAGFGEGFRFLANDATLRANLGTASARCANQSYSIDVFRKKTATAYDCVLRFC